MAGLLANLTGRRSQLEDLTETVLTESASLKIDEDAGIIRGVKIIGRDSGNGYPYSDQALREGVTLYEGSEVCIDHPRKDQVGVERPTREVIGQLRNVVFESRTENAGDFGELHYLKNHPDTPLMLERYRRGFPLGLSHNAQGTFGTKNGKRFVESLKSVRTVDMVRRPATTKNLHESLGEGDVTTINEIIEATKECKARTVLEAFGAQYPQAAKAPMPVPPGMSGMQPGMMGEQPGAQDQALKAALNQALNALMDNNSLTLDEVIQIIQDKVGPKADPFEDEEDSEEDDMADEKDPKKKNPFKESLQALTEQVNEGQKKLAAIEKKTAIRDFMESNRLSAQSLGAERVKLLEACADEPAMKTLLETWPLSVRNARPPLAQLQTLTESRTAEAAPKTFQATRSLLRSR